MNSFYASIHAVIQMSDNLVVLKDGYTLKVNTRCTLWYHSLKSDCLVRFLWTVQLVILLLLYITFFNHVSLYGSYCFHVKSSSFYFWYLFRLFFYLICFVWFVIFTVIFLSIWLLVYTHNAAIESQIFF